MSEPSYIHIGPPITWTVSDIRSFIERRGLFERDPNYIRKTLYYQIEHQMEDGEKFGFFEDRIYLIEKLQEKYEAALDDNLLVFVNRSCPHCLHKEGCLVVWRVNKGSKSHYITDECRSTFGVIVISNTVYYIHRRHAFLQLNRLIFQVYYNSSSQHLQSNNFVNALIPCSG